MVIIRFDSPEAERRALGWLAGRFSFKTWANGELMLEETALPYLARECVPFKVEGLPKYEQAIPAVRTADPAQV